MSVPCEKSVKASKDLLKGCLIALDEILDVCSHGHRKNFYRVGPLALWCLAAFGDFRKKTPKRTWLCAGISPLQFGLRTWSKHQ